MSLIGSNDLEVFSICPRSTHAAPAEYLRRVADAARWSEDAGCRGVLVHSDNGLVDPWLVSRVILQNTETLSPLVAVQPIYMHPYSAAKMVSSLAFLHGRRLYLNFLADGFEQEFAALDDQTPPDKRYARTTEYALIMKGLLEGQGPLTFDGLYYTVTNLRLTPPVPPELFPGLVISGSSPAGMEAARAIGATAIRYSEPHGEEERAAAAIGEEIRVGIRVGIIAREETEEAWRIACDRFPDDHKRQIAHGLAMNSDSHWLSQTETGDAEDDLYRLHPLENNQTFCPYLVGSYSRVGAELGRYFHAGFRVVVLDIPPSREELDHVGAILEKARSGIA
jgi:alkanesulfonate monooxygenase